RRTPIVQGVRKTRHADRLGRLGRGESEHMERMGDGRCPRGAQSRRPDLGRPGGPDDAGLTEFLDLREYRLPVPLRIPVSSLPVRYEGEVSLGNGKPRLRSRALLLR